MDSEALLGLTAEDLLGRVVKLLKIQKVICCNLHVCYKCMLIITYFIIKLPFINCTDYNSFNLKCLCLNLSC